MLSLQDLSSVRKFSPVDVDASASTDTYLRSLLFLVKLPFPLTIRFKSMLQSGIATRDLDVRWVSSLSWYFLNLFGLQSVFIFILGNDNGEYSAACSSYGVY